LSPNPITFHLICYDIVSDSRRARVAKILERYGWRVQKSVFEAVLVGVAAPVGHRDRRQFLERLLLKTINPKEDQVRFYPLSKRNRSKVKILGTQPEFAIDDNSFVV